MKDVPDHVETVPAGHRDKAAELLDSAQVHVTLTAADNRRVLRKIDLVILPILLTVYFLQALDKATLAYASVFGLIADTGLVGEQYSWLGSIVYIAQLIMQPPVAYFLVKFPIGKFTGVVVLGWGIILCCMAIAHNFSGLMATRFFLGAFEASVGAYISA
jgi:MFS family permease